MSLHKFAEQVAAQGRGDDSLLVHMTPDEVQRLQKFAEANGRSLTINPETGLPEAGFLSDLFKAVAPIALGAFLGPAGAAFGGGLMSAGMAGLTVGGITTLATGSLSRGLMAGLGAYGGAGLGESLMSAGTGAGMTEALAGSSTGNLGQAFGDVAATATDGSAGSAFNKFLTSNANPATMSASELASSGLKAAASDPLGFAKSNLGNLAYAAAPIMAGAMVPTTTKLPDPKDTGRIRQMAFNINPDTGRPDPLYGMREMPVVKTSDFGDKTFKGQRDLFYQQNPNPYELGVGSLNQPPQQPARMNTGGIVALAGGGDVIRMAGGTPPAMLSDEALYQQTGSWEAAAAARDAQNNALNAFNNQQAADARDQAARASNITADADRLRGALNINTPTPAPTGSAGMQYALSQGQTADQYYNTIANQYNDLTGFGDTKANATDAQIDAALIAAQKYGVSQEDFFNALGKTGGSLAQTYAIGAGNMGLSGLNQNINDYLAKARLDPTFKAMTGLQQQEAARAAMGTVNMNEADVIRATGKTIAELFPSTLTKPVSVIPTGYYGNNTGNAFTTTPGDITTNPDGSVTVHPNIPGRPDGGFTGMGQVRDTYTAGGGSLGYTAAVPKTAAEHNALYNKQTDDSLDAYNYLMGKGKNLTQRKAETKDRPVMARYDEAILGRKIPRVTTVTGNTITVDGVKYNLTDPTNPPPADSTGTWQWDVAGRRWVKLTTTAGANTYRNAGGGDYGGYGSSDSGSSGSNSSTTGGVAPGATDGNVANSITGLAQGVDPSITVSDMSTMSAEAAAAEAAADAAAAAAVGPVGDAPGAPGGGGDGGGDGGGGGGGDGGGCVDPAVLITLADGSCVPAGSIKVGDVIFAMHEKTLEFGAYPVEYVEELDQPKALVLFDDGSSMLVSHSHKFFMIGGEWKQVYQLEPGDTVKAAPGATDKTVIELDPKGDGPVMKFTVTDAHTYISEGLISHNSKAKGGVVRYMAQGGMFPGYAMGGGLGSLGTYSDGGRLLRGPGDGVSDSIPATIGRKRQPARLADGEFVIPARIVSELGNGSTEAGAKKLYAMMDRVQRARGKTTGKNKVAANSRADKYLPA